MRPAATPTVPAEQVVRRTWAEVDAEMASLTAQAALEGSHLACKEGCAACCTYVVGSTPPESAVIAEAVQRLPAEVRKGVIARLVAWERAWRLHGGADAFGDIRHTIPWNTKRRACPMLDLKTFGCLVYGDRPISCRVHHACYMPPEADRTTPCGCESREPGEGCFTTEEDAAHGHHPWLWMFHNTLQEDCGNALINRLRWSGYTHHPVIMPLHVLKVGRLHFGWQPPAKMIPLPILRHASPPGAPR